MPFRPADRLSTLPAYLFVEIDRKKRAARAAGKEVIDFGLGDPDAPSHTYIRRRLHQAVDDPANDRYPASHGSPELRGTLAAFFRQRYDVELDPEREILALIGSKEGLGHLPLAVVNPGQTVLVPDPAYPVYRSAAIFAGGVPSTMRLTEAGEWLPDLDGIPAEVARSATLLYLNYPNNPTAAVAPLGFYEQAVEFARRYELVIAQDAAYNEIYFEHPPPSILQVGGAKDVAVEFHSLSKTFNMTGWRLGFAAGNADAIAALARVKDNLDSGPYAPIQAAGIEAYAGIDRPELTQMRATYHQRAELLCHGLREFGFRVQPPAATFYVWARVPKGYDSMGLATKLLDEARVVCVPGVGFGAAGEGYVRFALTLDIERIRQALARLREVNW
jgi:LL-diaminopimelate aminotransferase